MLIGLTGLGVLALPPVRLGLEASMAGHMLVQLPLLVGVGVLLGASVPSRRSKAVRRWNEYGIPGTLLAILVVLFWMLPRHLDAALERGAMDAAKHVTLVLLAGVPLGLSWPRLPVVGRGLVYSKLIAMLVVLGWLYLSAPLRVCNNYLLDQQALAGQGALLLALGVTLFLVMRLFSTTAPSMVAETTRTVEMPTRQRLGD